MSVRQVGFAFVSAILLLPAGAGSCRAQYPVRLSAADLIGVVIGNELATTDGEIRWMYLLDKEVEGKQETREVVETKFGSLDRLLTLAGKPLTAAQEREETARILKLSNSSLAQRQIAEARRKDAEQCNTFLQMVPAAFVFDYAGGDGRLVKVIFRPNPRFRPATREATVIHAMAGEILVDSEEQRLVSIHGRLIDEVRFAGGLLGRLEKDGQFTVKRAEIAPGRWEVIELAVNMRGKALLFKTISVQQKEMHSNFARVPDDLSLSAAAGLLLRSDLIAAARLFKDPGQDRPYPANVPGSPLLGIAFRE